VFALSRSHKRKLNDKIVPILADLNDYDRISHIFEDNNIDIVCHLAACAIVKKANDDPRYVINNNLNITTNLLEACRKHDVERFHLFSTDKVMGNNIIPTKETHPLLATGPYEVSKLISEKVSESYGKHYGLKIVITRSANIYGGNDKFNSRIIPNTIRRCLEGKSPIIYENDHALREYIHVSDICSSIEHVLDNKLIGNYNVGTGETLDQEKVVLEILKHFKEIKPIYQKKPDLKEIADQMLDSSKLRQTGWKHKINFETGIKMTVDEMVSIHD